MTAPVELHITRFATTGEGIAQYQGRSVFVPGTIPGEVVLAQVEERGKALRGTLTEIRLASPNRRELACEIAERCGGCDWMHLSPDSQRRHKEDVVLAVLEHLGGLRADSLQMLPFVQSPDALGYRRRAVLHPTEGGLGFHARNSHERVTVERCPALSESLASLPQTLAARLGSAVMKELEEVRLLECEGRIALSFHLKAQVRPRLREAIAALLRDGVIDGALAQPAEGKGALEQFGAPVLKEDGLLHRPDGFAQANVAVNRQLVRQALNLLAVEPTHDVLELYSGNGNFTFELARQARSVVAVESAAVSVTLAQGAARQLGVSNVRFIQGDSEKTALSLAREGKRFHRLLMDPPRNGAPGTGEWAARLLVERMVYVACEPTSLARDAKVLMQSGFKPVALQLFDLFPQTHHVEAVLLLER